MVVCLLPLRARSMYDNNSSNHTPLRHHMTPVGLLAMNGEVDQTEVETTYMVVALLTD